MRAPIAPRTGFISRVPRPKSASNFVLDGNSLTTQDVVDLGDPASQIKLSESAMDRIIAGRKVVDDIIASGKVVYGINTGFGENAKIVIPPADLEQLQHNLILSHATGSKDALPLEHARSMVALRINTLARGNSGIAPETLNRMIDLFNLGLTPNVPKHGSVGASGDLAPLACIAAAYF